MSAPFIGRGWAFPPEFHRASAGVVMSEDERDIEESLQILFTTAQGERILNPKYGLDMHEQLFEPMSTTMRNLLKDRIKVAVLVYEPRIRLLGVELTIAGAYEGRLEIALEYEVRATNTRYNLVFPFYLLDSNELAGLAGGA